MAIFDALIVGAGPVALAQAQALKLAGLDVCLCGELPPQTAASPDLRTAALFDGSLRLLERLDIWRKVVCTAAPIDAIRIIDATGHLLRAPEQLFSASDIGEMHLGFNVPNPALVDALIDGLRDPTPHTGSRSEINLGTRVTAIKIASDHVTARLNDGTERHGRIAIAADGRRSIARSTADITVHTWDHDQAAVTAHFTHAFDNAAISSEFQSRHGPCTVVPLDPHRASLVWMNDKQTATELANLNDQDFAASLEDRLQGLLGPVSDFTPRRVFALSSLIAQRFAANRVALIGEAAHAFPPIGAQGLNLGLRDVASLTDHLKTASDANQDLGADNVLSAYDRDRRADVTIRTYGVDAFNRSLSGAATGLIRGAALHAAKAMPGLRRFMMQRGTGPVGDWPALMQPYD